MRAPSAWLAAGALALAACTQNPAPAGWLPPAQGAAVEAYGGWIVIDTARGDRRGGGSAGPAIQVAGELIAVDPDTVFVMSQGTLVSLTKSQVERASLFAYDAQSGRLALWGFLGTLSSAATGFGALLLAPVWIIGSTAATASRSNAPVVELTSGGGRWAQMALYARFPQGLPPGVDRAALRPVPERSKQPVGKP